MATTLLPDDRRSLTLRLAALQYIVAIGFAALAVGFWIFQIAQHEKFLEIAENNRTRRLPLPAARGVLLDRSGKVLVENQSTFNIALIREQTKNGPEVLRTLALATGVDEAVLRETVNRRRRAITNPSKTCGPRSMRTSARSSSITSAAIAGTSDRRPRRSG